jgi:hypothetical protein
MISADALSRYRSQAAAPGRVRTVDITAVPLCIDFAAGLFKRSVWTLRCPAPDDTEHFSTWTLYSPASRVQTLDPAFKSAADPSRWTTRTGRISAGGIDGSSKSLSDCRPGELGPWTFRRQIVDDAGEIAATRTWTRTGSELAQI